MWAGPTFQSYYLRVPQMTREFLDNEDPKYLLEVDFEHYLDYLVDRIRWEPQEWDEAGMTIEPFTTKVERMDDFDRRPFTLEVQRLRVRMPLAPHPQRKDYFKFGPSTTWGSQPDFKFEGDTLVLEVEATESEVEQGLKQVTFWLGNRNSEIEGGNKGLRSTIRGIWETKREQLETRFGATDALVRKLNIPLHQDPNAPIKPIEIKERPLRTVVEKPPRGLKSETALSREDVSGLVDFIYQYTKQFEVAPRSYDQMDEEKLRDLLIGMMNVNYPGSTTGETFNKLGKTDISFRVDSGHVLICECKFWAGAKTYGQALDQLFRYLTWRQNYGVLISFSKLKGMTRAIEEATKTLAEHESFTSGSITAIGEARLVSRHVHPQDPERFLEVFHLFVDLSS